ncbi:MAG: adenylyl-sulfate kinase, partial [Chlamydiia bacterium]|nr:adenylyl-sulfate kinase [Chlamydiia bacterium]
LYQKAKEGEIKNFTGFDSEYEPPLTPEVHLETEKYQANTSVEKILDRLRNDGVIRDLSL